MNSLTNSWRRFLAEGDEDDTAAMAGSPREIENKKTKRIKETVERLGYYLDGRLGSGQMGDVFLVENKETGERRALKVVTKRLYGGPQTSKREAQNYRFAMENKDSMEEKYAKYLPEVYEVVEEIKDYYIFMEVLEEVPERVRSDLFIPGDEKEWALSREEKYKRILKDQEAVYGIVAAVLTSNEMIRQSESKNMILQNAPNDIMKSFYELPEQTPKSLYDTIIQDTLAYIKDDPTFNSSPYIAKEFKWTAQEELDRQLNKQIVPIHQGGSEHSPTGPSSDEVMRNFPEAENLMNAMRYFMRDQNWQPKDVHSKNVMARPSTGDFVIVDLGLFDRGISEHQRRYSRAKQIS